MYFQQILALLLGALSIDNAVRQQLVSNAVNSCAKVLDASQKVDTILETPGVSKSLISGLIDLAKLFGGDRDLSDDQKAQINAVAAKLVDIPDNPDAEAAIENLFYMIVDALDSLQELVADENTAVE